jgi:hypothetical protein
VPLEVNFVWAAKCLVALNYLSGDVRKALSLVRLFWVMERRVLRPGRPALAAGPNGTGIPRLHEYCRSGGASRRPQQLTLGTQLHLRDYRASCAGTGY